MMADWTSELETRKETTESVGRLRLPFDSGVAQAPALMLGRFVLS